MTRISANLATTVTGSGPAVLLAHGAGGSIAGNYGLTIAALAEHHTVVAPDYPGSGKTPRATEPLTLDGLADALVESATAAGAETFTVLGYSMGTMVAVRAAARHPERVRGLVLTAGLARPDNRLRASLDLWRKLLDDGDLEMFARFVVLNGFSEDYFNSIPEGQVRGFLSIVARGVPAGAGDQAEVIRAAGADTTQDLPGITVPTLVIATTRDALVSPRHSRILAAGIRGAEYEEIDSGHAVMVERSVEWNKLILSFLERHGL
ncbi:alpha/beta hydrolase [Streptomyces sp. NRRL B-1568]|nr:alpha/beta hydrolase [Streptomyces sp. NRRL B-1568]